ncbi:MAG: hypothetical protein ACTSP5_14990 [Candidatus Heimdallarchaeota archaeon]
MSRKVKILLGIFIPVIVIGAGVGGLFLAVNWPAVWSSAPPVMAIPIENTDVVDNRLWMQHFCKRHRVV